MEDVMFRTSDYIFRPTTIGDALRRAGVAQYQSLVREPRIEIKGVNSHQIKPRLEQK